MLSHRRYYVMLQHQQPVKLYQTYAIHHRTEQMSRDMRFPTMWHFDLFRLRQACAACF